jgi:uncharacterized membrane protein YbhN (UPF0104 family)
VRVASQRNKPLPRTRARYGPLGTSRSRARARSPSSLGAACLAYGVDLSFAQLLLVNTAASAFAGLIPVPGGVGAAEASLTAGLVAMGVNDSTAFAIAFTHRLCTYYLPPIWGYFSMKWLVRKAYI